MNDLTPEERRKNYQEEKARLEFTLFWGVIVLVVLITFATIVGEREDAKNKRAFEKLTPEQREMMH